MASLKARVGILVGGGPAPGINGVISAATIEAINSNLEVIGLYDGFKWLMRGDKSHIKPLAIEDVSRIHNTGGSILRTSRANPTESKEAMQNCLNTLRQLQIAYLVAIGGDDTGYSAGRLCEEARGDLRVAHVPKTIDNDLPVPSNMPTFGFETARHVGTQLVQNLMEDARTTSRWYFVAAMGRKAGHLALGIGKAAGATLTLIGEEFPERIRLAQVLDVLEGAMIKRKATEREHGVAIVAEGIIEKLDVTELKSLRGVRLAYDEHGHLRLSEVPLANILKRQMETRFARRKQKITIVDITLGYELRSADPIPFDCEYVRDLGNAAIRFLLRKIPNVRRSAGAMVCIDGGRLSAIPFEKLPRDLKKKGRLEVRLVDTNSDSYQVAREYMIRLEPGDLENPELLQRLAKAAGIKAEKLLEQFGPMFTAVGAVS